MRKTLILLLLFSAASSGMAQDFADGMSRAQSEIDSNQWHAALELLLPVMATPATADQCELLAARLFAAGEGLRDAADFANAQRAYEAASTVRRRVHGEVPHPDVARDLNGIANCILSLGRAGEALQQFQAALAMRQQLAGGAEHLDVAQSLADIGSCLPRLGRFEEALLHSEQALTMRQHLYGSADALEVAESLNNVAVALQFLGRGAEALPRYELALAMFERLHGGSDCRVVATGLNNIAYCLQDLGRWREALPRYERALAMWRRLRGDVDHPDVAVGLNNLADCLRSVGRGDEALQHLEAALAMSKRMYGDADHPDVARLLGNIAGCQRSLGRDRDALANYRSDLAMTERLHGGLDHPSLAGCLSNLANCLRSLGRSDEALPHHEAALAMFTRLYRDADHPDGAKYLNNLGYCLQTLGRSAEALPRLEAALAMERRLCGELDHPYVARDLEFVAVCLLELNRAGEALQHGQAALAMLRRLHSQGVHPELADALDSVASCLSRLDRDSEALPLHEEALAMWMHCYPDADHPRVALSSNHVAMCLVSLGRFEEALSRHVAALTMLERLHGDADHPHVAHALNQHACCLQSLGRAQEALLYSNRAIAMIERLRDVALISAELRQSMFDQLKDGYAFERAQVLAVQAGRLGEAFHTAERSRGRDLLDVVEQQRFDCDAEAERRARKRGDEMAATRIAALRTELDAAREENDWLLHLLTEVSDAPMTAAEREARRSELLSRSRSVSQRHRQLLDERARLLGSEQPVGRALSAADVKAALHAGELLLEFTVAGGVNLLYVLASDREVEVYQLPKADEVIARLVPALVRQHVQAQVEPRGRHPERGESAVDGLRVAQELFDTLIPRSLWPRLQASERVFLAAHRELHLLPFESLVTETRDGKPVHWLDNGPPIAYVPSGSALHWLRQRAKDAGQVTGSLDLLAVGDPGHLPPESVPPENGVFVVAVTAGGQGERLGIQPRDVLLQYDGKPITDQAALAAVRQQTDAAIAQGQRPDSAIPLELWRAGELVHFEVSRGPLGIRISDSNPRLAWQGSFGSGAEVQTIDRPGDLERVHKLPRLVGARAEAEAIAKAWNGAGHSGRHLSGEEATEPAVFDLAGTAEYLHFACHGIAEEYAGQSLSMLVLSQPRSVMPDDDGLLKLSDLLIKWRSHLSSCRLVVLSACRTYVGPTLRDEAPQALAIGFLLAGAPSVISSLWAVDDASTRELMTDFYGRLLAGESDRLKAFTDSRRALKARHPDPFHWAPFLYLGIPK